MKKLSIIIVLCFALAGCGSVSHLPFAGQTKHKTVEKQSRATVRRAQEGKTCYTRYNGKVYRNTRSIEMAKCRGLKSMELTRRLNR